MAVASPEAPTQAPEYVIDERYDFAAVCSMQDEFHRPCCSEPAVAYGIVRLPSCTHDALLCVQHRDELAAARTRHEPATCGHMLAPWCLHLFRIQPL